MSLVIFRRREANRDLAMAKLKEGDARAASELFQVSIICHAWWTRLPNIGRTKPPPYPDPFILVWVGLGFLGI